MTQIIIYFAVAAICVILYIVMTTDAYFRKSKAKHGVGRIVSIISENGKTQFQVAFIDDKGEQQTVVTPKYSGNGRYTEGVSVPILYNRLLIPKIRINSVRIADDNLVKVENYKAFLALAGVLLVFAILRILSIMSGVMLL